MDTSNSTPSVNGEHTKPAKKKRARKKAGLPEGIRVVPVSAPQEEDGRGRLASDLRPRGVQWLLQPWVPLEMLSLVIGLPSAGKSTFMAWLIAQAGCAVLLPGFEEVVEVTTLPRLLANGVNTRLLRILDDRDYRLPRDKKKIASILRGWEAQLLVLDPIDSYMEEELNENTGRDVRLLLESAAWIAAETGAAVVGVRHPGKDRTNPLPGSRQWRAVPRSIAELMSDGGNPPRLLIRHYKDSLGQDAKPREFRLEGERGRPRKFLLAGEVDATLNDLASAASDPSGRRKVLEAAQLIRHLFQQDEKPAVQELVAQCRLLGVGEHARDEAKRLLGIITAPLESGGKWVMFRQAKDWPSWLETADSPA